MSNIKHATNRSKKNYWFVRPGSKVEVRSDEDGYQNAWFSGTVLEQVTPSKSGTKRMTEAVIVYDNMLDEETREPLVEKVKVKFIRPTPPEESVLTIFEPNDVVDAFYDDVWWTGYVVRVVNDRYTVAFKSPPDVLEVGRSELRLHWDWVHNSYWDKPPKEANTRSFFSPTMEVEVDPNEDNPGTTWWPGIYLGKTSSDFHMVKYRSSDGDDEAGLLKVQVQYNQIRPRPPKIEDKDFELLEKVDALHGLAWTVGVITKILVGKKYAVSFKSLMKEVDFDYSKLRPHMEWIDGQWVSKMKGLEFKSTREEFMRKCDEAKSIEIITLDESSSSATIGDKEEVTYFKQLIQMEPSPIIGSSNNENVISISNDKSAEVVLTRNDEITTPNKVEEMDNHATKSADKSGPISWAKKYQRSRFSKSRFPNLQSSATCINVADTVLEASEKKISEFLVDDVFEAADMETSNPVMGDDEAVDRETSEPVMQDGPLESVDEETSDSSLKQAQSSDMLVEPKDVMDTDIVENSNRTPIESDIGMSCELNQVHEFPESPVLNLQTQMETDNEICEAVVAIEDCITEILESPAHACSKSTGNGTSEAIFAIEGCTNGLLEAPGSAFSKLTATKFYLVANMKSIKTNYKITYLQAHDSADDQAFSLDAEGTNCSKNVNGSGDIEETDVLDLPFVKSSPIWKFIQSMEVFVRFPQSPHFRPLLKYDEKEREGIAVGHMVNYANMMARISKLKETDSKEHIDCIARGFSEYEEMGFDVKAVKDCLNKLLEMKIQIEKLEHESKKLASVLEEFVDKETRIEEEVSEIDREIEKLTRKRSLLMEENAEHRSKIMRLSLEAAAINADLLSRREYSSSLVVVIVPL